MHALHLVAVQADNEKLAIESAKEAIAWGGYGVIWDWYSVGGIWKERFNGKLALRYTDNPQLFMESIDMVLEMQKENLKEQLEDIREEIQHLLDMLNEANRDFQLPHPDQDSQVGRAMYEAGALLTDIYTYNSHLYDAHGGSTDGELIRTRCHGGYPDKQWLVVFDLHI